MVLWFVVLRILTVDICLTKSRAGLDCPKQRAVAVCPVGEGVGDPWDILAEAQPNALRSSLGSGARSRLQALLSQGRTWSGHRGPHDGHRLTVSVLEACLGFSLQREVPLCSLCF